MSLSALVKLAPVCTAARINDQTFRRPGRKVYWPGSLRFLPGRDGAPLIVDHDDEREVGRAHALFTVDERDGLWIVARCTVNDPPCWLDNTTKASFRHVPTRSDLDPDRVVESWVTEVSLLSPGTQPNEPGAQVISLHPTEPEPMTREEIATPAGQLIRHYSGGRVLRVY